MVAGPMLERELTVVLETVPLNWRSLMFVPVSSRICLHLLKRESRRVRFMVFIFKSAAGKRLSKNHNKAKDTGRKEN